MSLGDMFLRRTPLAIRGDVSSGLVLRVADIMAGELGWSATQKDREIDTLVGNLANYHGVTPEMLERRTSDRRDICA